MRLVLPIFLTIGCVLLDHLFLGEMERGRPAEATRLKSFTSLCFLLIGIWFAFVVSPASTRKTLIVLGLLLGLIGDVLLAMRFQYPDKFDTMFLTGAVSFAVGHILYILAMLLVTTKALLWGIPFWVVGLALSGFYAFRKKADAGPMQIPGYGYMALVVAMGAVACGLAAGVPCTATILFALGGILFGVSDNLLAAHCFGTAKEPVYNRWVHYTYYAAQLLIAWSMAFSV